MKKMLLIATMTLAATSAFASKARLSSLNSATHLSDTRDVLTNPALSTAHGDWVTFEMGATATTVSTTTTPKAEGGFSRSMGESRYGFYLGNEPAWVTQFRETTATMTGSENPIDLFYASKAGDLAWGAGLYYSNSDKKATSKKQTATGINIGAAQGAWDARLTLGLTNTFKNTATAGSEVDFKGSSAMELSGNYNMDGMTYSASYATNGAKKTTGSTDNFDKKSTTYSLGAEYSNKKDGADFFYGVKYNSIERKDSVADTKYTETSLPVYAGIEAEATSWMVMRASVTQNVLLGSTKEATATGGEADTIANNTAVAAGVGMKWGKLTMDASLAGATSGDVNGSTLLSNAALTYMF